MEPSFPTVRVLLLALCSLFTLSLSIQAQSAHDFYHELYKSGGLDRMSDGYACFDNDPELKTFFIFGKSQTIKQFLIDADGYSKLPLNERKLLDRGFLYVKQYDQGVPLGERDTYVEDGGTYLLDGARLDTSTKIRIRLSISWQTLRYKKTVDVSLKGGPYRPAVEGYGRCEEVSADVEQKGN